MSFSIKTLSSGAVLILSTLSAQAADTEVTGYISGDLRYYPQPALHSGQEDQTLSPSVAVQTEINSYWNNDEDQITFIPFLRLDGYDKERSHADIRELNYQHIGDGWDVNAGFDKVFWGVTESRHLVDIVNQTDTLEGTDGEDKLGQPMINVGFQQDWGDINVLLMPYFRERAFTGSKGRLRAATLVDADQTSYESSSEEYHPDVALRYSTVIGDIDLGLGLFHGTSREPGFLVGTDSGGNAVFTPYYEIINQASIDAQMTVEEWLWKIEAIGRSGHGETFGAVSTGLEYTLYGVVGEAGDLGLIAEYHYDGRDATAPGTFYNDDLFFGARIALNDADDTSFLAGVIVDRLNHEQIISMEASTRLSDQWTVEGELNINNDLTSSNPFYGARRDDHAQVRVTYYF